MKGHVFLIGLGLIGGSIALALRSKHRITLSAYDISEKQLKLAEALGVIDLAEPSIQEGARKADLIIIATPVQQTRTILTELATCKLKPNAIITDVGSTKLEVMEMAQQVLPADQSFIGGHPMAGSHKSGVEAAQKHLFENAFYILTPTEATTDVQMQTLKRWLAATRATIVEMSAAEHDKIAGAISHFPHIVASALVQQVADLSKEHPIAMRMAAGGFRDITRIASSSPTMWRDVLLHNKDEMLAMLEEWKERMNDVQEMLKKSSGEELFSFFEEAKFFRDALPVRAKGAIPSFYDLYVDVPDYPGVISEVTRLLAEKGISLTNLRILETREDILGALRLSFRTESDRQKAEVLLEEASYPTYISG
ncbi:prephenate dehydrogenase [Bacillaceae bacterium SIJ1]|uniref:prephenate dehydrogenase n=1 Tax=Litoribacterium kuwaitense TaxID=1398745 RepID=UPI0013EC147E|nr:prephenate dehydrogenase [Litoribacterium kuwaitense]NGP43717.1 prephenate dehydrogenase [Litoribacterium kuwaitense]